MPETKQALRKIMRERRLALGTVYARGAAQRIAGRVTSLAEFRSARAVLCYLAMKHEVDTDAIVEAAWRAGKRLAVPARGADGEYRPAWLEPGRHVVAGCFGLREPEAPAWAEDAAFDVSILPGVVFSPAGGRIGHGRGYIDRMLARMGAGAGCKVGVCFHCQVAESVPAAGHDIPMDVVVTEDAVYRKAGRQGGNSENTAGPGPETKGDAICG